ATVPPRKRPATQRCCGATLTRTSAREVGRQAGGVTAPGRAPTATDSTSVSARATCASIVVEIEAKREQGGGAAVTIVDIQAQGDDIRQEEVATDRHVGIAAPVIQVDVFGAA